MHTSVAFLLCCFVAPPVPSVDPFVSKLDDLLRQDWSLARHVRITAWERFIAKYPKHPRVAQAMISLGHLHAEENLTRKQPEKSDQVGSLAWFRRAVSASKTGSDLWVEAQFLVASRVVCGNPAEARSIYRSVKANRTDFLTLAKIEHEMATVCSLEGNRADALRHDLNVIDWYKDDPRRRPADANAQRELDSVIYSASSAMTQSITRFPLTKRDRAAIIRKLMVDRPFFHPIQRTGEQAFKILDSMPEYVPPPPKPLVMLRRAGAGSALRTGSRDACPTLLRQPGDFLAGGRIPETHRAVLGAGRQRLAVRSERRITDAPGVPLQMTRLREERLA